MARIRLQRRGTRFLLLFKSYLALSCLASAQPIPSWWHEDERGATNSSPADDLAVANLGQLKHFASRAALELNAVLPGGAGAEVNALVAGFGVNLAVRSGVVATQSSTTNGGVADRARDGNTSGDWIQSSVTHTTLESDPWWQADLGALRTIHSVEVWNRTDSGGDRTDEFYVMISDADMSGRTLSALLADGTVWKSAKITGAPNPSTKINADAHNGRFVMIRIEGIQYLHLAEVKVAGTIAPGGSAPDDYAAATIGQLKYVGKSFYNRLLAPGAPKPYPWTEITTDDDDKALVTLGQVKAVFGFDLDYDWDQDGLPDWWENQWFDALGHDGTADFDGDGTRDAYEILNLLNPRFADGGGDRDGDAIINERDARPSDVNIGMLNITISMPLNGSSLN